MIKRKLTSGTAILIAAFGVLLATTGPALADTGAGGLTILHASTDDLAHKCNVIGGANTEYSAVICDDVVTYEGSTEYYVYDRSTAYCQVTATAQVVACDSITEHTTLETGDGGNATYTASCSQGSCPASRLNEVTGNYVYDILAAGNGVCSSNVNSSYQVWGIALGSTQIQTPSGQTYSVDNGNANDGVNESSGHYFVCP